MAGEDLAARVDQTVTPEAREALRAAMGGREGGQPMLRPALTRTADFARSTRESARRESSR